MGEKCSIHTFSMFISWLTYETVAKKFIGKSPSEFDFMKRITNCGDDWRVVNEYHYELERINSHGMITVNEQLGVAVVSFRGTELRIHGDRWDRVLNDWIFGDMEATLVNCHVHHGFQNHYKTLQPAVEAQIKTLLDAGYRLIITGHSKGGALAAMSTFATIDKHPETDSRISMVSFASPRVGDDTFVNLYNKLVLSSVNYQSVYPASWYSGEKHDIVTTVPPEAMGFRHTKNIKYVVCNNEYFGNPNGITGTTQSPYVHALFKLMPSTLGCHFQQVYLDGLFKAEQPNTFEVETREFISKYNFKSTQECLDVCAKILYGVPCYDLCTK
ncbi:lipase [Acrasis kona]|uniref:Lipase n=1 Tax=Acrasis kona TaxID=1008807 RepID=A0AAW2YIK7_9EUKA